MTYSERERQLIAEKEYNEKLLEDSLIEVEFDGKIRNIGVVSNIYDDPKTGLYAIEVLEPDGDVTLWFHGSAVIY